MFLSYEHIRPVLSGENVAVAESFVLALGNIFRSCTTNVTLILGVFSLFSFSKFNTSAVEKIMFYGLLLR